MRKWCNYILCYLIGTLHTVVSTPAADSLKKLILRNAVTDGVEVEIFGLFVSIERYEIGRFVDFQANTRIFV